MSSHHNTISSATGTSSTSRKGGRPKKWWTEDNFELEREVLENGEDGKLVLACKTCAYKSRSARPNATRLGEHLLKCKGIGKETRARLLQEKRLQDIYKNMGCISSVFGHQLTPTRPAKRKKTGASCHGDTKILKSSAIVTGNERSIDSYELGTRFQELVTELMVARLLPFSLLSRTPGEDQFFQLLRCLNPKMAYDLPTPSKMGETHLSNYYRHMKHMVCLSISNAFREGYGTLVFDGWTDATGASVVNILLSITGSQETRRSFFLKSILTGSESCDAVFYADALEETLKEFGTMDRICGIVSDNASSCVSAKAELKRRYNHLLPCQDQTHLANLLMQDIGALRWIDSVLKQIAVLISEIRNRSKLYHALKIAKEGHNANLYVTGELNNDEAMDEYGRVCLPKTAILPKRMVATRFASCESMLSSFLRNRSIMKKLVVRPDFGSTLFGARDHQRRQKFITTVFDDELYASALDVYHIMRIIRQYLRFFDDESSLISEVFPLTLVLKRKLSVLPTTPFFTTQRHQEVLEVFMNRFNGSGRKIPLLQSIHFVAFFLDLRSALIDSKDYDSHIIAEIEGFVRSSVFPDEKKTDELGGVAGAVQRIFKELTILRVSWKNDLDFEGTPMNTLSMFTSMPVMYWFKYHKSSQLRSFALRVLCTSPSSASAERSFSLQRRVRTQTRNRLVDEKVQKLVFCAMNDRFSKFNVGSGDKRWRESLHKRWDQTSLSAGVVVGSGQSESGFDICLDASEEEEVLDYDTEDDMPLLPSSMHESNLGR